MFQGELRIQGGIHPYSPTSRNPLPTAVVGKEQGWTLAISSKIRQGLCTHMSTQATASVPSLFMG